MINEKKAVPEVCCIVSGFKVRQEIPRGVDRFTAAKKILTQLYSNNEREVRYAGMLIAKLQCSESNCLERAQL